MTREGSKVERGSGDAAAGRRQGAGRRVTAYVEGET